MTQEPREIDETRLCPVCRMPISVLAIRCRYCGEEVGRPRKEQETLTVKDLGGEQKTTYTVSGNVLGAIESFRAEELASQDVLRREREAARSTWFGKSGHHPPDAAPRTGSDPGLPELDATHRELAFSASSPPLAGSPTPVPAAHLIAIPGLSRKLFLVAAVAAGLVLLYLGTDYTWAKIKDYMEWHRTKDMIVYKSKGLEFLAQGRPSIEALEESLDAVKVDPSPENKEILETVRRQFRADIEELLRKEPWLQSDLDKAASLVNRAVQKDSDSSIVQLMDRVNKEVAAYRLILIALDVNSGMATFRVHDPTFPEKDQTVKVGDYVMERFLVKRIGVDGVALEDTKMPVGSGYRRLKAGLTRPVSSDTVSIVGPR